MVQAVSRQTLTANARVRSHISHMGFVVDKVALGDFYLRVLRFCPIRIVPSGCTLFIHLFFLWLDSPIWAWASSFRRGFMVTHFETHHSR
jgi:hypothetical protein